MHEGQQAFWDSDADLRALLAGRRWGKSHVLVPWIVHGTYRCPGAVNPYISITRRHAKLNFWDHIKAESKLADPSCRINESELTVRFTHGGIIWLGGWDNITELEKSRGSGISRAVVDECGSMVPEQLEYLLREVLRPATADYRGKIALAGTCGKVLAGYWYSLTKRDSDLGVPVFRGTMCDNPHIPDPEGFLATVVEETPGWAWATPAFRREYLAEWTDDPGALVYPFTAANDVDELPRYEPNGTPLDREQWRYVIGVDVGYVDALAIVVVAGHRHYPAEFIVSAEKHTQQLARDAAARLLELRRTYPRTPIVVDTGGMGKAYAEEFRRIYHIPVEAAQKTEKEANIELVRDRIAGGFTKIISAECEPLLDEAAKCGWDARALEQGKRLPDPAAEDHALDAMCYSLRRLRAYHAEETPIHPKPGTEEHARVERDRLYRERVDRYRDKRANRRKVRLQ